MKNFSNTYIFTFSLVMVIIVATLLAAVANWAKPIQQMNVETEKKQDILRSVGEASQLGEVKDKKTYITDEFNKYITESFVVNFEGDKVAGEDAYEVTKSLKEQTDKPVEERMLPVFVYVGKDNAKKYIFPVRGKGLWGPIWGYVSLDSDLNTIFGAVFDHSKETPGLGAEINTPKFQSHFPGKKIFGTDGSFKSVTVVKGGASPNDPYGVDAISGGTITSKGLQAMLHDCLSGYVNFIHKELAAEQAVEATNSENNE